MPYRLGLGFQARATLSRSRAYCDNSTTIMPVTTAQVKMARAALGWTVRDLADATGLHRNTINNVETGRYRGDLSTLQTIEKTLVAAGIEFIPENGGGPGVRLRKRQRSRKVKKGSF